MSRSDATSFEQWKSAGGFVDQQILDSSARLDLTSDHVLEDLWTAGVVGAEDWASGSPVLDADWNLVHLHTHGTSYVYPSVVVVQAKIPRGDEWRTKSLPHASPVIPGVVIHYIGSLPMEGLRVQRCLQLDTLFSLKETSKFGGAWHSAFTAALAATSSAPLRAATTLLWERLWQRGPLREPHIESPPGELRFTWNRTGHYLEVSAHDDGHLEWFYRDPDGRVQGGDESEDLPEAFFSLLRHARP